MVSCPKHLVLYQIGLDIDVYVHLHVLSVDFTRIDEISNFDFQIFRKPFLCTCLPWINIHVMMKLIVGQHTTSFNKSYQEKKNAVQIPLSLSDVHKAGRHSFEPFMFILGIFKWTLRTKAYGLGKSGFHLR